MSNEKSSKGAVLNLYIGMPEEDGVEFLYVDLTIPGQEVNLYTSKDKLNDCSGDDFLEYLEQALNTAFLWSRYLNIQIQIETESLLEMVEDYSERTIKGVKALLKEVTE